MILKSLLILYQMFYILSEILLYETKTATVSGDVMIGGLVAIKDSGGVNNVNCDDNITMFGIQRVEAMRYVVEKVGQYFNILVNKAAVSK